MAILFSYITTGCDGSFVAIEPSGQFYSVFGFLDASADTQWIRVMSVRDLMTTSPVLPGAAAFLEEVGTDRRIELRDSLFRFPAPNPEVGSEWVYVHNFWTTETIRPGAAYRFSAKMDGAVPAEATIAIPPEYDVEVWVSASQDNLIVDGVRQVAFASFITYFADGCGETWMYRPFRVPRNDSERHTIWMLPLYDRPFRDPPCGETVTLWEELIVLGSADPWPWSATPWPGGAQGPERPGVTDAPSNVSNAVGFLGGAVSRRIPYESCDWTGFRPPSVCALRYDDTTAQLSGTVSDICGGTPVAEAGVEMEELGDAQHRRIRSTVTRRSGEYLIAALEGERRYQIQIRGPRHNPHTDTIEVAPGERRVYDAVLTGFPCGS